MNKKSDPKPPIDADDIEFINDDTPEAAAPSVATAAGASSAEDLQAEITKLKNDELYLRAEFDNYRRQAIKERADILKFGGERLAKDLLDTLDIFDTALSTEVTAENWETFKKGIELTAQQLRSVLQKHNIQEIESENQPFNPAYHEALGSEARADIPEGHISKVFKKPYKYHDKIIRYGQVIVATSKKN